MTVNVNKIYSLAEASEITGVPLSTLRSHIYVRERKRIEPLYIGSRAGLAGNSIALTERMLKAYMRQRAGDPPVSPTEEERREILSSSEAAALIARAGWNVRNPVNSLKQARARGVLDRIGLPSKVVGTDVIYVRSDVLRAARTIVREQRARARKAQARR